MCKMKKIGILQGNVDGSEIIRLFDNESELNSIWNMYTEYGRKRRGFKKVTVEYHVEK